MSRAERLFDLLQILRRHRRPVSGAVLAREAGISLRTLYRDIASLQALGAEIEGEPGLGYVLKPGFLLPPLMFSGQEIEALALGLQWVGRRTDEDMGQAARNVMAKVAAVLPADLRERMEDDALVIGHGWDRPQAVDLAVLRRALNEGRKLSIAYTDEKAARSERIIWPVSLGFFETTRVLVAWCELRGGFRHFRTDRIEAAEILPERVPRPRRQLMKEWQQTLLPESDSGVRYSVSRSRNTRETPMSTHSKSDDLVFYTNPQSRGAIVHWMLEEIGRPYTLKVLDFTTTMKAPDYLAINPMGKVPAIRHGETVVTEVAAICAYLADAFPEAGLAPEPKHRGDYYRWLFFTAGCLEPAASNHVIGWDPSPDMEGRFGYGSYARVLDTLSAWLEGRTYVAGDRFTAADVVLASHLQWGMMSGMIEKRRVFEIYSERHVNRPAAKRADEQAEKLSAQQAA
ncbi:HTH domain-containing protein [Microvirga sp. CF3016]|uniref:HTH domain-containing protein n=1 Tax=Microvirga sp. CF3016 TaxID=3110181 RepID=UPI002E78432C|nr:HTH domain-containing protein [Microvirga sp. CF3016]MEE1613473.1 HTH domain-containing protein [Microvirga sp. CF3016]